MPLARTLEAIKGILGRQLICITTLPRKIWLMLDSITFSWTLSGSPTLEYYLLRLECLIIIWAYTNVIIFIRSTLTDRATVMTTT